MPAAAAAAAADGHPTATGTNQRQNSQPATAALPTVLQHGHGTALKVRNLAEITISFYKAADPAQ
jgi:3D (Asp-Asp-Asp) domain-containing protein